MTDTNTKPTLDQELRVAARKLSNQSLLDASAALKKEVEHHKSVYREYDGRMPWRNDLILLRDRAHGRMVEAARDLNIINAEVMHRMGEEHA